MTNEIRDPSPVCPTCGRYLTVLGCTAERCARPPEEDRHDSDCPGRYGNACYGCTRADLAALIEVVQAIHATYELNCAPRSKTVLAEARKTMERLVEKYGSKP